MKNTQWENYVDAIPDVDASDPVVRKLLALIGDKEFVKVIYFHFGDTAIGWLDKPVPALGHKTPSESFQSRDGIALLKETLMRMPC